MDPKTTNKTNENWIRCQSKSRPNQFYMFNCSTGETRWCLESSSNKTRENIAVAVNKMKTPAQDRLKRLQKTLSEKTKHKESNNNHKKQLEHAFKHGTKAKKQSSKSEGVTAIKTEGKNQKPTAEKSSPKTETPKKVDISKRLIVPKVDREVTDPPAKGEHTNVQNMKSAESISKDSSGQNAPEKLTTDSKPEFRLPKKTPNQADNTAKKKTEKRKHDEKLCTTSNQEIPSSSCPKKIRVSNELSTPPTREESMIVDCDSNGSQDPNNDKKSTVMSVLKDYCSGLLNQFNLQHKNNNNNEEFITKPSSLSSYSRTSFKSKNSTETGPQQDKQNRHQVRLTTFSAKSALSSSLPIGNANDRLQRLRNSLQEHQAIESPCQSLLSSSLSSSQGNLSVSQQDDESMDWQPAQSSSETLSPGSSSPNVSTSSEHLLTINENLLRLAAEKKRQKTQWLKDHFYFIVDTNVFLENITFVDELIAMKLSDTQGTVIYVPFCVLQELDKLKIRSPSESIKLRSARAIKFLNKALESRSQNIQAQSSAEENRHLIKVTSPDDSILNCCLQVREHIDNLILLTEDINLRNKAISSDILVSTKSDLISKHETSL